MEELGNIATWQGDFLNSKNTILYLKVVLAILGFCPLR